MALDLHLKGLKSTFLIQTFKMEEQKYYTPTAEDLRIGFMLDHLYRGEWHKTFIGTPDDISFYASLLNGMDHVVRVPYLTAEQIEAEGWITSNTIKSMHGGVYAWLHLDSTEKYDYKLFYSEVTKICRVVDDRHGQYNIMYEGPMRCVNELHFICKMLGIETTKNK